MCTAYELGKRGGSFPARARATAVDELLSLKNTRLLRPTLDAPVIDMEGCLVIMRWGFRRPFSNAVVNAREDKLEGRMWKESMDARRCLVPASAYYEWSGPQGMKRTHRFSSPEDNWLWIAGIWEEDGELGKCFSMITTAPTGVVQGIHDRMPAVLSLADTEIFLDGGMRTFRPAVASLQVEDAINPLTGRKPGPVQGELF